MSKNIYSNIVEKNKLRQVQKDTLQILSDSLYNSFGPMGSYTAIVKNKDPKGANIDVEYTKDGHTIVKNILFLNPIERSVQDILVDLTHYIVKEVGDGTTSTVMLCNYVFKCLCESPSFVNMPPSDVLIKLHNVIIKVIDKIKSYKKECTLEDIYRIALISTNNNEDMSKIIYNAYKTYGLDTYIDIGNSNLDETIVKEYDGMTLETGFSDPCFINSPNNVSTIRNPKIYAFWDPVDTEEMIGLFNYIIDKNIFAGLDPNDMTIEAPIPTVILCKKITPDASSYLKNVVDMLNNPAYKGKVPLLIVSNITNDYLFEDIAKLCGTPFIKKYLNAAIQKKDIEAGLAPTLETVVDFCGSADAVSSDQYKTKFINPKDMLNPDGTKSDKYKEQLTYLETALKEAENGSESILEIGRLRRRLNSFKGNMIDLLVGGITSSDKGNLKASVEDAVLNCRSAVKNGVGYGANYMALSALHELLKETDKRSTEYNTIEVLYDAYVNLVKVLYSSFDDVDKIIEESYKYGCPLNIRTNEYDYKVLSSIQSDIAILTAIDKVLGLMFTCNQYLVQRPDYNVYNDCK